CGRRGSAEDGTSEVVVVVRFVGVGGCARWTPGVAFGAAVFRGGAGARVGAGRGVGGGVVARVVGVVGVFAGCRRGAGGGRSARFDDLVEVLAFLDHRVGGAHAVDAVFECGADLWVVEESACGDVVPRSEEHTSELQSREN